ncbi:MAG: ABC transporter ATP-binding protein [bacterium]
MQNIVEVQGLHKSYGRFPAVRDLSFSIAPGEIFGFLGPNGAGKTSTLRMMLDIITPDSGRISILGHSSANKARQQIGYLPEERGLYKKMKVRDAIAYFARLKNTPSKLALARADALLDEFGLSGVAKSKVQALSKGMAQKVQLISTIAHEPDFLILDEPFSGLDPVNQQLLEKIILNYQQHGKTILFSTHVMQHAERLCDRFMIINKGREVFQGTLDQAHATLPESIILTVTSDVSFLSELDIVKNLQTTLQNDDGSRTVEVTLTTSGEPHQILKLLFERGIDILRFDRTPPALHDLFIHFIEKDNQVSQTGGNA